MLLEIPVHTWLFLYTPRYKKENVHNELLFFNSTQNEEGG